MTNAMITTALTVALGATVAVPATAGQRGTATVSQRPAEGGSTAALAPVATQAPPTPPAPATAPTPPSAAARAARDAARAQVRAQRTRGPWVYAVGEPLSATFSAQEGDVLELANTSGDVVITGGPGREGRVVARRKAGGRTDAEARALVERVRLEVTRRPQRVVLRGLPDGPSQAYRLDYEITVPAGVGVDVRNVSGSVRVVGVAGDVRVEALSGDITGEGLARVRSLKTMSGDIMLAASTLVGEANLQTVSGDVVARGLTAPALTLGSVSGSVHLKDADCDRVQVRTVNGDIEFDSPALGGGRYELKTHAGSIRVLTGASSAGFQFEAQTFKGRIQSETGTPQAASPVGRQLSGRVGDGSAFFELTSFVGDIVIRK